MTTLAHRETAVKQRLNQQCSAALCPSFFVRRTICLRGSQERGTVFSTRHAQEMQKGGLAGATCLPHLCSRSSERVHDRQTMPVVFVRTLSAPC